MLEYELQFELFGALILVKLFWFVLKEFKIFDELIMLY
jgi:hypothetical protein